MKMTRPPTQGLIATRFPIINLLSLLAVMLYIAYLLHPILNAEFDIIDDHDLVQLSSRGYDFDVYLKTIQNLTFLKTENRFIPGYLFTRYTEVFLSGPHPKLWYLIRYVSAIFSGALLYLIFAQWIAPPLAALSALILFLGNGPAIWSQIGATENLGIPVLILGLGIAARRIKRGEKLPSQFVAPLLISGFAAYVKESFTPIFALEILFLLILARGEKWRLRDGWVWFTSLVILFFPVAAHFRILANRNLEHVQARLAMPLFSPSPETIQLLLQHSIWSLPLFAVAIHLNLRTFSKAEFIPFSKAYFAVFLLGLTPQWLIYGNTLPDHARYLFPSLLICSFLSGYAFWFLSRFIHRSAVKQTLWVCFSFMFSVELWSGAVTQRQISKHAEKTRFFQTRMTQAVDFQNRNPEMPIVLCSMGFLMERALSISHFLKARDPQMEKPILLLSPFRHPDRWHAAAERQSERAAREGNDLFRPSRYWNHSQERCFGIRIVPEISCPCKHVINLYDTEKPFS